MDSSLKNKKFGVVHTSPSEMVSSDKLEVGKLYFAQGAASGAAKQGVYALTNMTDVDGVTTPQLTMFGTGAVADGTGYGLSQENFTTALKTALNNLSDIDVVTTTEDGYVPKADGSAGTIDNQASDWVLAFDGSKVDWFKLPANAFKNDNTTYNSGNVITIDSNKNINHNTSGATAGRYGDTGDTRSLAFGGTFKVLDTSVDAYGHITAISTKTLTLPSKPSTAGTADKVAQTFDVSFGGADILTYNGSANKTLAFKEGTNIDISNSNGTLTIATTGVPTTDEMNTAIATALTSALKYKGTVANSSALTSADKTQGSVYVASASFTTTEAQTGKAYSVEAGDYFISNGTTFDVVNGENQVSNANATLTIGGSKTVATVDGTDITISLPSSGYYTHPASINGSTSVSSSDGGDFAFSSSNTSLQVITGALRDASGHISKLVYKDVTLPSTAYSDTKYTHPASITGTTLADSSLKSSTATNVAHSGTFTVATGVYRDASGHISKVATETFKLPSAYSHPAVGTTNTACSTSANTDVTLASGTTFTVVNGVYRDASGHVNKVATTKYTMPASAFTNTKCTSLTLSADSSADVPTALYADVISNTAISASGSGESLSGTVTAVRVATQKAVDAAQEAATIYWETL